MDERTPEMTPISSFILDRIVGVKIIKKNFIIYLVNYFFSGLKNHYYNRSFLTNMKDVNQISSLNWRQFIIDKLLKGVKHCKENTIAKGASFYGPLFFLMVSSPLESIINN